MVMVVERDNQFIHLRWSRSWSRNRQDHHHGQRTTNNVVRVCLRSNEHAVMCSQNQSQQINWLWCHSNGSERTWVVVVAWNQHTTRSETKVMCLNVLQVPQVSEGRQGVFDLIFFRLSSSSCCYLVLLLCCYNKIQLPMFCQLDEGKTTLKRK